jgi:uncharacterized protein (TIGR02466 family)
VERLDLFATPVFVFDVPGMDVVNEELSTLLLEEEKGSPGLQRSNYGGWHSPMDLSTRPQACFRTITDTVVEHARRAVAALRPSAPPVAPPRMVHAWAMIMRRGDFTLTHDHGEADWSAVYYADAGDAGGTGGLAFDDPRPGVRRNTLNLFPGTRTFPPRTGAVVIFPGWLRHQVHTYEGERPRVSLAANLLDVL